MAGFDTNVQEALMKKARLMPAAVGLAAWQIGWPNLPFDPPAGGELWVEVSFFNNTSERYGLKGTYPERASGLLQFLIKAPKNRGWQDSKILADKIADFFPADLQLWSEDVRVTVSKRPDSMSPDPTEATWNTPVSVYYQA